MVPFLVVLGFLVFGCAIVGSATRHVWTLEAIRRTTRRPAPRNTAARSLIVSHPEAFADAQNVRYVEQAPVEVPAFDDTGPTGTAEPISHYVPATDPFAHAPLLSHGSLTGMRH